MITEQQKATLLEAVNKASRQWQSAFNSGDAVGCAAQYEKNAVIEAKPFGTFIGTDNIKNFWQKVIDDGFSDVEYLEPKIEVIDAKSAILTAEWKMNKAQGVIHKELWVLQENGQAQLREDYFEVTD